MLMVSITDDKGRSFGPFETHSATEPFDAAFQAGVEWALGNLENEVAIYLGEFVSKVQDRGYKVTNVQVIEV